MSRVLLQPVFHTRLEAIAELRRWYICPECGAFTQPFRLKETMPPLSSTFRRRWTLGCGHRFEVLDPRWRVVRAISGGHDAEAFLTFETREKDGRQSEHMTQWGRSFLVCYYACLYTCAANVTLAGFHDTGGTLRTIVKNACLFTDAPANSTVYGMVVGTDSTQNNVLQYYLNSLIPNGSALGDLLYGTEGHTPPVEGEGGSTNPVNMTETRTLTNAYTAAITINEVGLYSDAGQSGFEFIMMRDLTGGVVVNPGANTTGTYTLAFFIS